MRPNENRLKNAIDIPIKEPLMFPTELRKDEFYTIFRIRERQARYDSGSIRVSGNGVDADEKTILLPLPPNLGTAYGVNYTGTEFGVFGTQLINVGQAAQASARVGGGVGDIISAAGVSLVGGVIDALKKDVLGAVGQGVQGLALLAGRSALDTSVGQAIGAGIGVAKNPYQAIVFQNPNFRTHQFSYNLFASSEDESETIRKIILAFKKAMYPSFTGNGMFFKYPKVIDIEHIVKTADNPFMFKIQTSALTDFTVDYHGDGTPSYFNRPDNPAPTNVRITMNFQELSILTSESFNVEGEESRGKTF
jgi:hypothetical protein